MPPGPLRLALEDEVHSLDPAEANDTVSRRIAGQIFDTLTGWDPRADPPRLVPEILAELPVADAAGTTVVLRLRTGAEARRFARDPCLGGAARAVRASDVAWSLRRIDPARHPSAAALIAGRFAAIAADDDAATVTLTLTRPQPELGALLASPVLAIVPPECVAYYDGRDAAHPKFARHPVGSGPYVLDASSELPRTAVLVANPDLSPRTGTQCGWPGVSPVVLSHFNDHQPALRAFQSGELAALSPGQAQFAEVVADGAPIAGALPAGVRLQKFPALSTDMLVFRMTDADIGQSPDPRVDAEHRALRRAIALAFDGARHHRVMRNGAWSQPRSRLVPRGIGSDSSEMLHRFAPPSADLQQARQVLAAAGLDTSPRTLRYWTGTSEAQDQEATILRDALQPLGIDLQVTRRANYLYEIGTGDAQVFGLRFDADYLDAGNFLAPFVCGSPDNYSGYCDPAYDAAFAAFAALPPGPGRERAAEALERMLGEAVPVRPIDQTTAWYFSQPWLHGLLRHPLLGLRIELLCADR